MGRNVFVAAFSTAGKITFAMLVMGFMCACSANVYMGDGSKTSKSTVARGAASEIENGAGSGESPVASDDGQNPTESKGGHVSGAGETPSSGGQRTYTDGQSAMRSPSGRLPDMGGSTQSSAAEWHESPLLSKRHYPIPNYADPSSDAGVLPYMPHDVNGSPGYVAATTIPAPSGLIVMSGALARRSRRRIAV